MLFRVFGSFCGQDRFKHNYVHGTDYAWYLISLWVKPYSTSLALWPSVITDSYELLFLRGRRSYFNRRNINVYKCFKSTYGKNRVPIAGTQNHNGISAWFVAGWMYYKGHRACAFCQRCYLAYQIRLWSCRAFVVIMRKAAYCNTIWHIRMINIVIW